MLALLLMMQEPVNNGPVNNGNVIAAQNASIASDIKKSENADDNALRMKMFVILTPQKRSIPNQIFV